MKIAITVIIIGMIIFASHFFSGVFRKTKIPDSLWLFVIGLIIGPLTGLITPESFGAAGDLFTAITLVVILFESGINLHIHSLKHSWKGSFKLTFFNFVATTFVVALLIYNLTDLGLIRSLIIGSILGGTSSAIVVSLSKQLNMDQQSQSILVVESALSDVFTLAIPIALITTYISGELNIVLLVTGMATSLFLALVLGSIGALVWSFILKKIRTIENSNFTTVAFVFIIYGMAELVGFSGPIATLAFGIVLGNIKHMELPVFNKYIIRQSVDLNKVEKNFFSEIVFLLRTFFFLYIGICINLNDKTILIEALIITIILFIIRVPLVFISVNQDITKRDASFIAVMIPKGLGAAVLASLPLQENMAGGTVIQSITFSIIFFTTIFTTLLVFMLEKVSITRKVYFFFFKNYRDG